MGGGGGWGEGGGNLRGGEGEYGFILLLMKPFLKKIP